MLMLFVLSDKTWTVVKPGALLARAPPRAQQPQDMSPILSMVPQALHSQQQSGPSETGHCPGKDRSLSCFVSEA